MQLIAINRFAALHLRYFTLLIKVTFIPYSNSEEISLENT